MLLAVNELTEDSRKALVERYVALVIATPLEDLCRGLVGAMIDAHRGGASGRGEHFLTPQLYLPESI